MIGDKNTPLVTVAMVTYNSEKYVRLAIDSVLTSCYSNFELVISDDCSSDNTWDIICEFTDPRIRAYRNEKNISEYPNRNRCIELARGKYFIFIDGDDTIMKRGIESAVEHMELYPDAAIGFARPKEENHKIPKQLTPNDSYRSHYLGKSLFNLSFARNIFRTEIIKKEGGIPVNYISGDTVLRLKIAARYYTLIINDGLGIWRQREGQASEILQISIKGLREPHLINRRFLNSSSCPLTKDEIKNANRILNKKIIIHSLVILKKGNTMKSYSLFKLFFNRIVWASILILVLNINGSLGFNINR